MWLFALFIAVPLIEIGLFIKVGGLIGLWPTLGIVLLTAILGTWLMRREGARALGDLQRSFSALEDPTEPLAHGAMILFAGALLLTPGFFTDAVGFALLIPPVRHAVYEYLRKRVRVQTFAAGTGFRQTGPAWDDDIIDAEFTEVDPAENPTPKTPIPPTGHTRH